MQCARIITRASATLKNKKDPNKIQGKMPKKRNLLAVHAHNRKAGPMKDRRAPRGGAKNRQKEYEEDYD